MTSPLGSVGGCQLTSMLVVVTLMKTGGDRPLGRLVVVVTSMGSLDVHPAAVQADTVNV